MDVWAAQKCPVCGHQAGLHSGPGATACVPGTCHGGLTDGGWRDCGQASTVEDPFDMPGTFCGWHPDLMPAQLSLWDTGG